jgi:hypothetical protein
MGGGVTVQKTLTDRGDDCFDFVLDLSIRCNVNTSVRDFYQ